MSHVLLNYVDHKDLRVRTDRSAIFGDNVNFALITLKELKKAKYTYPLFFQKDNRTGRLFLSALFGFYEGDNLFLTDSGWDEVYIPSSVLRQPFLIGQAAGNSGANSQRVVYIDIDHSRVNTQEGERLFFDGGEPTPFLTGMAQLLEELHQGIVVTDQFIDLLTEYNLLESLNLTVTFNEYKQYELKDLFTINEDVLAALSAESIYHLFKTGALDSIYSILYSQQNIAKLIETKKQQELL